ncbi:MAG TPA: hypothetical protein VK427_11400 [Kofleriaceae bacterium]|nr:hypothetical protein [Kofleriaceae bacterium]
MFGPHDGTRVTVHPYRRMMLFLMRGRNESAVYFEQRLDVRKTLAWLAEYNRGADQRAVAKASLFHVILHALASTLHERERLNRFTVGSRTYQRTSVQLSFAAKKAMSDDAPLATIKRRFDKTEAFDTLVGQLAGDVHAARSSKASALDKELGILLALPSFLLAFSITLLRWLYAWGLAPRSLVDTDPLYTSAFIANLGSIEIDAAYHHLYEHGNCPLFVTIGRVDADQRLLVRYTFDERVEDGLYCARALQLLQQRVEEPGTWISR